MTPALLSADSHGRWLGLRNLEREIVEDLARHGGRSRSEFRNSSPCSRGHPEIVTARKSARLRALEGNVGHRAFREHPKPQPIASPCPRWLPPPAREVWKRVVPALEEFGLIGDIDVATLEAFALSYARWRAAEKQLEDDGLVVEGWRGVPRKHPAAQLAREYREACSSWPVSSDSPRPPDKATCRRHPRTKSPPSRCSHD
jgi:P27 family predicted phage terminase small subunit